MTNANFVVPKLATINECAKMANLAKYHIRQIVLQGKVRYVKAGKKYLINIDSLIEYLNNGVTHHEEELKEECRIKKVEVKHGIN